MLVITRKVGEQIVIGGRIVVTVTAIRGNRVSLGIEAPREIDVGRAPAWGGAASEGPPPEQRGGRFDPLPLAPSTAEIAAEATAVVTAAGGTVVGQWESGATFSLDEEFADRALRCPLCSAPVAPHDLPPSIAPGAPESAVCSPVTASTSSALGCEPAQSTQVVGHATANTVNSRLTRLKRLRVIPARLYRRLVRQARHSLRRTLLAAGAILLAFSGIVLLLILLVR